MSDNEKPDAFGVVGVVGSLISAAVVVYIAWGLFRPPWWVWVLTAYLVLHVLWSSEQVQGWVGKRKSKLQHETLTELERARRAFVALFAAVAYGLVLFFPLFYFSERSDKEELLFFASLVSFWFAYHVATKLCCSFPGSLLQLPPRVDRPEAGLLILGYLLTKQQEPLWLTRRVQGVTLAAFGASFLALGIGGAAGLASESPERVDPSEVGLTYIAQVVGFMLSASGLALLARSEFARRRAKWRAYLPGTELVRQFAPIARDLSTVAVVITVLGLNLFALFSRTGFESLMVSTALTTFYLALFLIFQGWPEDWFRSE